MPVPAIQTRMASRTSDITVRKQFLREGCLPNQKSAMYTVSMSPSNNAGSLLPAESDHVTRILKNYGDILDNPQQQLQLWSVSHLQVHGNGMQLVHILRCLMIIMQLTGFYLGRFLPQVCTLTDMSTCMPTAASTHS